MSLQRHSIKLLISLGLGVLCLLSGCVIVPSDQVYPSYNPNKPLFIKQMWRCTAKAGRGVLWTWETSNLFVAKQRAMNLCLTHAHFGQCRITLNGCRSYYKRATRFYCYRWCNMGRCVRTCTTNQGIAMQARADAQANQ